MKFAVCFALLALASASPMGARDDKKGMDEMWQSFAAMAGGQGMGGGSWGSWSSWGSSKESKKGVDELWEALAEAAKQEKSGGAGGDMSGLMDLLGGMKSGGMGERSGSRRERSGRSDEDKTVGLSDLLELYGMGGDKSGRMDDGSERSGPKGDMDPSEMMKMFHGMQGDKSRSGSRSGRDGPGLSPSDLMSIFGGMIGDKKSEKSGKKGDHDMMAVMKLFENMDEQEKDMSPEQKLMHKAFMTMLKQRVEEGDADGVFQLLQWAAKMMQDMNPAQGLTDKDMEKEFEMIFMKAVQYKADKGDWSGVMGLMQMANEWKDREAMMKKKMENLEEKMHKIFMLVLEHKAKMGKWEAVVNMLQGAQMAEMYEKRKEENPEYSKEDLEGRKQLLMLIKAKAESNDWESVMKIMEKVDMLGQSEKKRMLGYKLMYFSHMVLGEDPKMYEPANVMKMTNAMEGRDQMEFAMWLQKMTEEHKKKQQGGDMMQQLMALISMMGGN